MVYSKAKGKKDRMKKKCTRISFLLAIFFFSIKKVVVYIFMHAVAGKYIMHEDETIDKILTNFYS